MDVERLKVPSKTKRGRGVQFQVNLNEPSALIQVVDSTAIRVFL